MANAAENIEVQGNAVNRSNTTEYNDNDNEAIENSDSDVSETMQPQGHSTGVSESNADTDAPDDAAVSLIADDNYLRSEDSDADEGKEDKQALQEGCSDSEIEV